MSGKKVWNEYRDPAAVPPDTGDVAAPLFAGEIFDTLTPGPMGSLADYPLWTPYPDGDDDALPFVERDMPPDESSPYPPAVAFLPGTTEHGPGMVHFPVTGHVVNADGEPTGTTDDDLISTAHRVAAMVEDLKKKAPATAIQAYLEWIHADGLPDRFEKHINATRARWHPVLVRRFLPQFPPLWDAPDEIANPDDPGYAVDPGGPYPDGYDIPNEMPIWQKEIRTTYGQESARVIVAANALHAKNEHALKLAHSTVHDPAAWEDHARYAIAHAALWRQADLSLPDQTRLNVEDTGAIFEYTVKPPVMARVVMYMGQPWALEALNRYINTLQADVRDNPGRWAQLIADARTELGLPPVKITLQRSDAPTKQKRPVAPHAAPLFTDGVGIKPTHSLIIGARRALISPLGRWPMDAFDRPLFQYTDANGTLIYMPSEIAFPDPQDALQAVAGYGVGHQSLFKYITMRHMQGAHTKQQGPYGGFYLGIDEYLEARGIQKHKNGGYKQKDRQEVERLMSDLARLQVSGNHQRNPYKRKKGDKGIRIEAPLIVVSHTVKQTGLTPGDDRVIAWYVRAGDWAAQMDSLPAQYGKTMQAIMQLHEKNDSLAIRLADALEEEFRIRATTGNWNQPYRVSHLFEIVEEPINRRNPARNLNMHKALDILADPKRMQGAPLIRRWRPERKIDTHKRGWLDGWLASGVIIEPAQMYRDQYKEIAANRTKKIEQNARKKKAGDTTG